MYSNRVARRKQGTGTPIYSSSGRVVGEVQPGGLFVKKVHSKKHFLTRPPAIGFDISVLNDAEAAGAEKVLVIDLDSGAQYRASIAHIRGHGFFVDRGFGRQIALPLDKWTVTQPGGPTQLTMFGGGE